MNKNPTVNLVQKSLCPAESFLFPLSSSASAPVNHQGSHHCFICHFSLQHSNKESHAAKAAREEQVILPDPFSLGKRVRSPNLSSLIHSAIPACLY